MTGESGQVHHERGMFDARDGFRLFERWWLPQGESKATVIIVHGFGEHSERYVHVAQHLTEQGYGVYAFDLRYHGRSGTPKAYVRSFDDYLSDLDVFLERTRAREPGKPLFLLGHSLGGAIVTLFTITRKPDIRGIILSSPALMISDEVSPLLIKLSGFIGRILPKLPTVKLDCTAISRDPEVVRRYDTDPLVYRGGTPARTGAELVRAIRIIQARMEEIALPLLIIHGTADRLAKPEGSKQLYERVSTSDKNLKIYEGLYHETMNEPEKEQVLSDIAQWLDAHCGE